MERMRPAMKWLRSAYIVYGIVFVGFLGGLTEILSISDDINFGLVRLLEKHPEGPSLNGTYLFPKNWLALFLFLFSLMLVFPATSLLKYFIEKDGNENKDKKTSPEITGLRQDLDDMIRYSENISEYLYSPADLRLTITKVDVKFVINKNGDTEADFSIEIKCNKKTAHLYVHWIRADQESGEVKYLRQLNIQVIDLDSGRKLDWLPLRNEPTTKVLAVFFPELAPGQSKRIKLMYRWPRFMGKLLDLGACKFDWEYRSQDPAVSAIFRTEWVFDRSFAPLECWIVGHTHGTATLHEEQRQSSFSWIYQDQKAYLNRQCAVQFSAG
jgi:hypothetical protein